MEAPATPVPGPVDRTIVMVGLMGAGKTSIGRRLAQRLSLPFIDADHEIETAAGCTIEEIFERYGEAAFRDGERKIIQRLLERPPHVLATGGGAFVDPETRARIKAEGISVWLKADLDVLVRRVSRRNNRPLLKRGEPREVLARLMAQRYPIYAEADICIDSLDAPADTTVDRVIEAIDQHRRTHKAVRA
ncbi:MAG TPA: shikimate kinase [Alphaproteobacteria bacterium]|nr:shikimate kinase [Alphaproteobacteria bacterium]